jgi:4-oxalocrotonate tautomerase
MIASAAHHVPDNHTGGPTMPLIEVTAFKARFESDEKAQELIARLTDAMVEVYGENVREETWVILNGVAKKRWGFGGKVRG